MLDLVWCWGKTSKSGISKDGNDIPEPHIFWKRLISFATILN